MRSMTPACGAALIDFALIQTCIMLDALIDIQQPHCKLSAASVTITCFHRERNVNDFLIKNIYANGHHASSSIGPYHRQSGGVKDILYAHHRIVASKYHLIKLPLAEYLNIYILKPMLIL